MSGVPMMIPKWVLKKLGFTGTTAEVNAAISSGRIKEGDTVIITDDNNDTLTASQVSFDNTGTGMSATSAQGAITELNNDLDILKISASGSQITLTPDTDYICPADGYTQCGSSAVIGQYVNLYVNGNVIGRGKGDGQLPGLFGCYVRKGCVVKISGSGSINGRFVPFNE